MPSFDIVSRVEIQEIKNAVDQVKREIDTRYDFKKSKCTIELEEKFLTVVADNKMFLESLKRTICEKMAKRGVSIKSLVFNEPENASGGALRQKIDIKQGIDQDEAKKIVKLIKDSKLSKVQAQIQQDQVRVTGPKKDVLQEVISLIKEATDLELQFINFRD